MQKVITLKKLNSSYNFLRKVLNDDRPRTAIILGSGLDKVASFLELIKEVPYQKVPFMPCCSAEGHKGNFIFGKFNGKDVAIMQGRIHYYEGYSFDEVIYPVHVLSKIGCKNLIITAAVGAVSEKYSVGDIVFIKGHINFIGDNPLRGIKVEGIKEKFIDLSNLYTLSLREIAKKVSQKLKIKYNEGVYLANCGPTYETPEEVKAFRLLGADVVGMSVVPEAIAAKQCGMNVLCICYIANTVFSLISNGVTHKEVLDVGSKIYKKIEDIIKGVVVYFSD